MPRWAAPQDPCDHLLLVPAENEIQELHFPHLDGSSHETLRVVGAAIFFLEGSLRVTDQGECADSRPVER
jgi:hypothetical protein